MFKIHAGFKAIAILMGPAALISGHQKISGYLSSSARSHPEPIIVTQPLDHRCPEAPDLKVAEKGFCELSDGALMVSLDN